MSKPPLLRASLADPATVPFIIDRETSRSLTTTAPGLHG